MAEQNMVNVWQLSDLRTPWCVYVAATLHIADHLQAGVRRIEDLAKEARCDAYALHRVLTHLVSIGVFEEPDPGLFLLNEPARQLIDPILKLSLDLNGIGGRFAHTWGSLLTYVQTGKPGYAGIFGLPFWEDLAAHPDLSASFDALIGPAGHGLPNPNIELKSGWQSIRTVADIGGGTGALLAEILHARPEIKGILVDQPMTVARSTEIFRAVGVSERVRTVGQSFFDPLPAGADLYILKGVLNDWPDDEAVLILPRCAEAARAEGRVVVLGGVFEDGDPRDLSIEMILLGGKYRTVTEMRALARQAGLEVVAAGRQPSGFFITECALDR